MRKFKILILPFSVSKLNSFHVHSICIYVKKFLVCLFVWKSRCSDPLFILSVVYFTQQIMQNNVSCVVYTLSEFYVCRFIFNS